MACSDDQQPNFKHFCKICKKGFMCGRALGGHMRAHGVGDETMNLDDDDDDPSDDGDGNQRVYALRTNHNRFRRFCENCGKEFLSWKSFLEHGKCGSEDGETSLVWSQETDNDDDDDDEADVFGQYGGGGSGLSKRKRSVRVCSSSANEEDITLAKCLMALSNNSMDLMEMEQEANLNATTNNKDEPRRDIFEPIILQSSVTRAPPLPLDKAKGEANNTNLKGMFQCKACKKVFSSHQALGGHRASHKNVKGCFASRNDQFDDNLTNDQDVIILDHNYKPTSSSYQSSHGPSTGPASLAGRKTKEHKCSICYRTFASGQALGGHKRCHWITSNYATNSSETTSISKLNFHQHIEQLYQRALAIPKRLELNLNLSTTPPNNTNDTTRDEVQIPIKSSEVSTEINLHAWTSSAADQENGDGNAKDHHEQHQMNNVDQDDGIAATTMESNVDEEDQSKAKLAKLGDLKDTNGDSSSWLQVGIGSITDVAPDP